MNSLFHGFSTFQTSPHGVNILLFLCGLGSLIGGVVAVCQLIWRDDFYNDDKKAAFKLVAKRYATRFLALGVVLWTISVIVPARSTIYAIAASEYGEQLLKSPIGSKAEKALEAWLDRQIARPSKDKDDQ